MSLTFISQRLAVFAISFLFTVVAQAQAYCVKRNEVSIYEKPGSKEVGTVEKFTPLSGTGEKNSRYVEVKNFEGKKFWIRSNAVTTDYSCVLVKVNKSRMRIGPGQDFDASDMSEKGQAFKDLGGEDGWTQVENVDGGKAWLNLDHTWKARSKFRMSFEAD